MTRRTTVGRRRLLAGGAGVGLALLAGCSGATDGGDGSGATGSFRLLVSDQPAAIGDFESLDVTLSTARVFERGDEEGPSSTPTDDATATPAGDDDTADDDGAPGVVEFDLDGTTVDLTTVVGDRALPVLEGSLPTGEYARVELVVDAAEGVVDGERVSVRVPSGRLRIVRPFVVEAGGSVSFVFDVNVVRRGRADGYNLTPVVGRSGVAGEDVDVEEVDDETTDDDEGAASGGGSGGY